MTGKIITTITKSISIITRFKSFKPRKNKFRDVPLPCERHPKGAACNCLKKERQNNYEEISDLRQSIKCPKFQVSHH